MTEQMKEIEIKKVLPSEVGALGFEPRSAGLFPVHSSSQSSRIR